MKNLLSTLTTLFLLSTILSAQDPANIVFGDRHHNSATHLTIDYNGDWLLGGYTGDGGAMHLIPPLLGTFRNEEWREFPIADFIDYEGDLSRFSPFASTPDYQRNYFIIGQGGCSLDLPNLLVASGSQEFWTAEIDGPFNESYALTPMSSQEGVLWAPTSGSGLYWQVDAEERIDFSEDWPSGEAIQQMQWMRPAAVLVRSNNRLYALIVSPFGIEVYRTYEFDDPILSIAVIDDQRVAVAQADSLFVLTGGFGVEFSRSLEGVGTAHLAADDQRIYLIQQVANTPHVFFYTHSAQEIAQVAIESLDYAITAVAARNGRLGVAGTNYALDFNGAPEPRNSQAFLRTYTEDGPDFDQLHDLAVESVSYSASNFYTSGYNGCTVTEVTGVNVIVRNHGATPIQKITLKYGTEVCADEFCGDYFTRTAVHNNINLQPGAMMELPLGTLSSHSLSPGLETLSLCIDATAPDHPMETDLGNNRACEQIVVVNTNEPNLSTQQLVIYPNPATDQVNVEWPVDAEEFCIYNAQGQLLQREDISTEATEKALDLAKLSSGVYFVRVRTSSGIQSASFVRQ